MLGQSKKRKGSTSAKYMTDSSLLKNAPPLPSEDDIEVISFFSPEGCSASKQNEKVSKSKEPTTTKTRPTISYMNKISLDPSTHAFPTPTDLSVSFINDDFLRDSKDELGSYSSLNRASIQPLVSLSESITRPSDRFLFNETRAEPIFNDLLTNGNPSTVIQLNCSSGPVTVLSQSKSSSSSSLSVSHASNATPNPPDNDEPKTSTAPVTYNIINYSLTKSLDIMVLPRLSEKDSVWRYSKVNNSLRGSINTALRRSKLVPSKSVMPSVSQLPKHSSHPLSNSLLHSLLNDKLNSNSLFASQPPLYESSMNHSMRLNPMDVLEDSSKNSLTRNYAIPSSLSSSSLYAPIQLFAPNCNSSTDLSMDSLSCSFMKFDQYSKLKSDLEKYLAAFKLFAFNEKDTVLEKLNVYECIE